MKTFDTAIETLADLYRSVTAEYLTLEGNLRAARYTGHTHYAQTIRIRMKAVQAQQDILLAALCDLLDADPETVVGIL